MQAGFRLTRLPVSGYSRGTDVLAEFDGKGDALPMPTRTSTSQPSPATPPQGGAYRHLACVKYLTRPSTPGDDRWLTTCYQLTSRLQRLGRDAALLYLGTCIDEEAMAAVEALLTRLREQGLSARAGIGPSGVLAQLALTRAPGRAPLALVAREHIPDVLQAVPIGALLLLHLPDLSGRVSVTPETIVWLERYGLRTLAHLARLDASHLRRQFGAWGGASLAAIARGEDPLPLQPTPEPKRLHFRLRLTSPVAPDQLVAGLAPFASEVARSLARRGLHGHTLELRLRWEDGAPERMLRTLPRPIAGARALAEAMTRLLTPHLRAKHNEHTRTIEDLRLIVAGLSPRYPEQHAFWPERAKRPAAVGEVADILARRHGTSLLFRNDRAAPDAIFEQDRSRLAPVPLPDADVLEGQREGAARPAADVAHGADAGGSGEGIPHGIHWW